MLLQATPCRNSSQVYRGLAWDNVVEPQFIFSHPQAPTKILLWRGFCKQQGASEGDGRNGVSTFPSEPGQFVAMWNPLCMIAERLLWPYDSIQIDCCLKSNCLKEIQSPQTYQFTLPRMIKGIRNTKDHNKFVVQCTEYLSQILSLPPQ